MSESRAHILEGVGRDEGRYQLPSLQGQCVGRGIPGSKCVIREGDVGLDNTVHMCIRVILHCPCVGGVRG